MNNRLLYRIAEAAEVLGVSRSKAYELVASGEIPSVRLGGTVRVPADALKSKIDEQVKQHATETRAIGR